MYTVYKLKTLFITLSFLPVFALGQSVKKMGSIGYLIYNQGFGKLKLGSDINLLPHDKLSFLEKNNKPDADSCFMYEYRDTAMASLDGIIALDGICLRSYDNKIVNIYVFFRKNDGYAILRSFLSSYGLFTSKPNDYVDIYNWESKSVGLSLRFEQKVALGIAIFSQNDLIALLARNTKRRLNLESTKVNE